MLRIISSLTMLIAGAATAAGDHNAAGYVWRNVVVGGGGFSPNIIFSPVQRGLAYLRTDIGGVYRWEDQQQMWKPLQDAMAEGSYFGIESIAADPRDANVVYVAAGMYSDEPSAILRSQDRGDHWSIVPVSFHMGGNERGRGLGERLAVDPNDTRILYCASRHDGLQRSRDRGEHWEQVANFTYRGAGPGAHALTHAGLSFVVFDPRSGQPGSASQTLIVGSADPDARGLYRSDDAGVSWALIEHQPQRALIPAQAQLDSASVLYVTYPDSPGPNGVRTGAIYKYELGTGQWTDISPTRDSSIVGGFMGVSVDRQHPGTLVVSTLNRYKPGDTLYRSTDGGATWDSLREHSTMDVAATPWLLWGDAHANFGWWMNGVAIDPFDSAHIAYTTGATIYSTHIDGQSQITWRPWVRGVEETAILSLASPPEGAHLLSGFGDIGGFVHDDFNSPPQSMYLTPVFDNTVTLDYAGVTPNVMVRGGVPQRHGGVASTLLAYSQDGGRTWAPLPLPDPGQHTTAIAVNADASTFIAMTPTPQFTHDHGAHWATVSGLPEHARAVADRTDGKRLYALDYLHAVIDASVDGGESFVALKTEGLPSDIASSQPHRQEGMWPLTATPGIRGELWLIIRGKLYRSTDGGAHFFLRNSDLQFAAIAFGKAAPQRANAAIYAIASQGDLNAIWKSDDAGAHWVRINDAQHEYGRRFRVIAGDPRVYGRVYVGTDGRGIVYGEPVKSERTEG